MLLFVVFSLLRVAFSLLHVALSINAILPRRLRSLLAPRTHLCQSARVE
jgi:hypothetical protein